MMHKLFINGSFVSSAEKNIFEKENPAHRNETIGEFADATLEDLDEAVHSARSAFSKWNDIPITSREVVLFKAADLLEKRKEDISAEMTREMGKPISESRGEVGRGVQILRFFAGEARRLTGETYPSDNKDTFLFTKRDPLGVVGLITPWNFPIAIPLWKLSPAIVYGNTAVIKISEDSPLMGIRIAELLHEASLPDGVVNILTGKGSRIPEAMIKHPGIDGISFTGSRGIGSIVAETCGHSLKKVQIESGGNNPVLISEKANIDQAVSIAIQGSFFSSGQKCTATGRIFIHKKVYAEFREKMARRMEKLKIGDGMKEGVEVGPVASQRILNGLKHGIEKGIEEGACIVSGGKILADGEYTNGFYIMPTLFEKIAPGMFIADEEVFGPFVGMTEFEDIDEGISLANQNAYGLSASIITTDIREAMRFIKNIHSGIVHVNSQTAGAEAHVPFGGMGASGNGSREQGRSAIEFYTQIKTVYFDLPI